MKFTKYIKDKIYYILTFSIYIILISIYLKAMETEIPAIIIVIAISTIFFCAGFIISYLKSNKYLKDIDKMMDNLTEKYLITEIMPKPSRAERLAYYRILKKANKSMLENISTIKQQQKDYKEYIESWVHEIKIPITSVKLLCENNKSDITTKIDEEIEEINNFVEQALFYARMDQVSNDFMIKNINLNNVINEKWLEFIVNQIIQNAIKYRKEKNANIVITISENKENVILNIKDNGIGIKTSEIDRIFDKGFTGTNGRNQKKSTGIGLYLCKRLCQEIGMEIEANSKENEFTEIKIIIPRNKKINEK